MIDTNDLSPVTLRTALAMLLGQRQASVSAFLADKWNAAVAQPSPVDAVVKGMEAAYAQMKATPADAATIAPVLGRAAYLVYDNGFHGRQARALEIYKACRRALGETVSGSDPEVDPAYVEPVPPESAPEDAPEEPAA